MTNSLENFYQQRAFIRNMNYRDSRARLSGFLEWLDTNPETAAILSKLENNERAEELVQKASWNSPPKASTPDEVVCIGLYFLRKINAGQETSSLAYGKGIHPSYKTNRMQDMHDEIMERYIDPAIDRIEDELEKAVKQENPLKNYPPVFLSGDFRGANLNINSTLTESSQIIQSISDANEEAKKELIDLLSELRKNLSQISAEKEDDAKTVAWAAEELIKARTSQNPNRDRIEITKEGLMKAASNISSVMPTVLVIAQKIIEVIDKIK
jgi:hypothetical protein